MKFELTEEMKEKLKSCKTPEEILELAKANNIEISLEEIQKAFSRKEKLLTRDELETVAGGCCSGACPEMEVPCTYMF